MKRVPTARDCMTRIPCIFHPEQDVYEAIDLLVRQHASGAPVVDDEKRLVGILTEKDCLRVMSSTTWGELAPGTVANYMSPVRAVIEVHQDLFTVAHTFLANNYPSLPVCENGRLVGTVSRQGVLKGIQTLERDLQTRKKQAERELRLKQSAASINDMQILVASERREHVAEVFRMRHDQPGP
jgi:CBS domain-containing protein